MSSYTEETGFIQEIKLISENARLPLKGSEFSACFDLSSSEETVILPGHVKAVSTGVCLAWYDSSYYVQLLSRSGLSLKRITVRAGVIDMDYRKEIKVILMNEGNTPYEIKVGDKIAQYTYVKIADNISTNLVEDFSRDIESSRTGGFGSTGR